MSVAQRVARQWMLKQGSRDHVLVKELPETAELRESVVLAAADFSPPEKARKLAMACAFLEKALEDLNDVAELRVFATGVSNVLKAARRYPDWHESDLRAATGFIMVRAGRSRWLYDDEDEDEED